MAVEVGKSEAVKNEFAARLSFETTGVRLFFGTGTSIFTGKATRQRLIYALKLSIDEDLELSSGEKTRDMPITLAITKASPASDGLIGALYYLEKYESEEFSHPARLQAEVEVPDEQFSELLALAQLGRFPREVSMEILGVAHGWVREVKWDTADKTKAKRAIAYADFSLPLGGDATDEVAENKTVGQPTMRDLIQNLQAQLKGIGVSLRWILGAAVIIAVTLIWRTHV